MTEADPLVDDELELVRRGFDPGRVQHLVGQLAAELRSLAAENDRLRTRLAQTPGAATAPGTPADPATTTTTAAPTVPASPAAPGIQPVPAGDADVFDQWSRETDHLMRTARDSIATVTQQATAQAAAAVAAGETAGLAIRQRAQLDADALLGDAKRRADRLLAVAAAERAAGEAEARVLVERAQVEVAELQAQVDRLRARRAAMLEQLGTARTHLHQLLVLMEDGDTATDADGTLETAIPGDTDASMPHIAAPTAPDWSAGTSEGDPTADEQH